APAITGTRPAASSTQISTTRICSSWLKVGDSPVVPQGTSPWLPCSICHETSLRNAPSSTLPFFIGVIRAGMEPLMRSRTLVMGKVPSCLSVVFHYGLELCPPSKLKLGFQQAWL